jgi:hypothetical protein
MWSYTGERPMVKGLDWIIAKGVEAMEAEHRRENGRLHDLVKQLGDALLETLAAHSGQGNGESQQKAVNAYNDYRAD